MTTIPDLIYETIRAALVAYSGDSADAIKWLDGQPLDSLSVREIEVARLVTQGFSNAEIASALFISERTARAHLVTIFEKVDVKSRTQLALWMLEHGIVTLKLVARGRK